MGTCIVCTKQHSEDTVYICSDCLNFTSNGKKFLETKSLFAFILDVINFSETNKFIVNERFVVDLADLVQFLQKDALLTE